MTSKSNYFKKTIGGAILGISLVGGIGIMSSTTAQAQYPNQDQYRMTRQQRERERLAQIERERQAQLERERQAQWNQNQDRNGRGDRDRNRPGRRGRGDGYSNYGGSYQLRQTALNAGYNEGMKAGRDDRNHGRNDFRRSSTYQKASKDYSSRLGDRNTYQRYFRDAFENGYSDGYYGY